MSGDDNKTAYEKVCEALLEPPMLQEQVVAPVLAKVPETESDKEDPCETCLRWWECNGVDEECPLR